MYEMLLPSAGLIFGFVTLIWALSAWMRRVSIIDAFWGPGFVLVSGFCYSNIGGSAEVQQASTLQTTLLMMTAAWGIRLGGHLAIRVFGEPHEDRRYAAMRSKYNPGFWLKSLWIVFWLQGAIMWLISLPLQTALTTAAAARAFAVDPAPGFGSTALFAAGFICWLIGLVFESVGDWQLVRFRAAADSDSRVLNTGLWRYTRHPNYFGDFMVWWGLWICSAVIGAPLWTIICPVVMSIFLMKFSGVGLLEKDIQSRRPGYAEYVRSTSTFFPWMPKSPGSQQG